MPPTIPYRFGDVVLVPFPFTDQSGTIGEVAVNHWRKAGLIKPGVVKPILTTIEKTLVLKKLGQLQPDDERALRRALGRILG